MSIFTKHIQAPVIILTIVAVLECLAIALLLTDRAASTEFDRSFDSSNVRGTQGFNSKDTLICQIIHATHHNGNGILLPFYEEKTFTLTQLSTDAPEFFRQDRQPWGKFHKQYDNERYVTLKMEQVEPSLDSDVIGLNKTTGTFVRTIQGIQGGKFQYAIAQKGRCE